MQQQRQGNSNMTMRAHTVLQSWHKLSFKRTVSTSLIGPLSSRLKSVWAFVKRAGETCAQKPVSMSDPAKTWESTGRKWQNIPQMTLRSVCQSMTRLLRAVIKAKKYRTRYQWPKPHFDVSLLTSISVMASFWIKWCLKSVNIGHLSWKLIHQKTIQKSIRHCVSEARQYILWEETGNGPTTKVQKRRTTMDKHR